MPEKTIYSSARLVTLAGLWLNLLLAIGKFIVGWLLNSRALISDGVHSLSDMITDFITLFAYTFARKPGDASHPYGHGRVESLATFMIAGFLALIALSMGYDAAKALKMLAEQKRKAGER